MYRKLYQQPVHKKTAYTNDISIGMKSLFYSVVEGIVMLYGTVAYRAYFPIMNGRIAEARYSEPQMYMSRP